MRTKHTGSPKQQSTDLGENHLTSKSGYNVATPSTSTTIAEVQYRRGSMSEKLTEIEPEYVCLSKLKLRGWTDTLIRVLLGEPDQLKTNPHYRTGPKMRLYKLDRIIIAESTDAFLNRRVRANGAKKAVGTKRLNLLEHVNSISIEINTISTEELTRLACEAYNDLWEGHHGFSRKEWKMANVTDDHLFIRRITVNYLRHEVSPYEGTLKSLFGMVGVREGSKLIKERVLDRIAEAYPHLNSECNRQKHSIKTRRKGHRHGGAYSNKTIIDNRSWG